MLEIETVRTRRPLFFLCRLFSWYSSSFEIFYAREDIDVHPKYLPSDIYQEWSQKYLSKHWVHNTSLCRSISKEEKKHNIHAQHTHNAAEFSFVRI
jgi:hypothetical protein